MNKELSSEQKFLSQRYIAYQFLTNLWFVAAVWLYFYRIFLTDSQVGIMDAMAFAIGLVAEIPSGALADKYGRDRMMKIGQFLAGSGILVQAFATTSDGFLIIFIGQAIMMIGVAFVSGADEALFFDKLKFDKDSVDWKKLVTRGSQVALFGTLLATIVGGLLHGVNPRIPWIMTGLSFILSVAVVWNIKDTSSLKKTGGGFRTEFSDYFSNIKIGIQEFFSHKLIRYVPIILTVQALFYASSYGLLRLVLLDRFEFSPFVGSLVVASSSLITIFVLHLMHKHAEELNEKTVIISIGLVSVAALLLAVADIGWWGYAIILALYVGDEALQPTMSESINNKSSDEHRATVLSVASFLKSAPYVGLALVIGFLNDLGQLEIFLVTWALLIVLALVLYKKLTIKK